MMRGIHKDKKVFTTFEVASVCRVSPATVISWVNKGKLKAYRTPGQHRRIMREELERFIRHFNLPDVEGFSSQFRALVVTSDSAIEAELASALKGVARLPLTALFARDDFAAGMQIKSGDVDIVVVDAGSGGLGASEWIRRVAHAAEPRKPKTVLVLSAGQEGQSDSLMDAGAAKVLFRPVTPTTMDAAVWDLLGRRL